MLRKGLALILSAPSGAGKTTLTRRLLAEFPHFTFSISCTTRQPRQGEEHGREYFFISREEFKQRQANGYFAEWAEVHGNFYGTPLEPLKNLLDNGRDLLFDIDVQGAKQLKQALPTGAVSAFILPPSLQELARRLRLRGTDSEEAIARRLNNARKELAHAIQYDALILNDDLDAAYDALRAVYLSATLSPHLNTDLLQKILSA